MSDQDISELEISRLFHDTANGETPEVERLVRGGVDRGRMIRRRRRIGTSLAAAAMVGVVGFAASVGPGLLSDDQPRSTGGVAADPTSSGSDAPTSSEPSTTAPATPKPKIAVKAKQIPDLVTAVVPGSVVPYEQYGGYIDAGDEVVAIFQLNGMLVTAIINNSGGGDPLKRCHNNGAPRTCLAQPDGSVLQFFSATGPAVDGGVASSGVSLYLPHQEITVQSHNAAAASDSPVLQPEPLITDPQLKKIVTQDGWVTQP